jgi:UDP-3-O-acyl-N-acetylglucosamine deacetylase
MPLMGHLVLYKAGHDVLNRLVRKILESPDSYRHIELGSELPAVSGENFSVAAALGSTWGSR